jgi:hypothetical protein
MGGIPIAHAKHAVPVVGKEEHRQELLLTEGQESTHARFRRSWRLASC